MKESIVMVKGTNVLETQPVGGLPVVYKRGRGFEHGPTVKQIQVVREEDLNPGPPDYKSSAPTTRPRGLPP